MMGHIPGAIRSEYAQDHWRFTREGILAMAPSLQELEQLIGGLGISNDDYVVVVPAGTSAGEFGSATRVYWQFKVMGHEKVSVLDGGFQAWKEAGLAVSNESLELEPVSYSADFRSQLVASREDVIAALESGMQLIDARSAAYYTGASKSASAARAGTIAGANNVPAAAMIAETGMFVDAETVTSLWGDAGAAADGEQIVFCNVGHLASLTWFAAYEVLGNKQARLYDGSMVEWSADPELPMESS
jgi:thiosulfate/3-mercaptopyruvate sulfurtransferase